MDGNEHSGGKTDNYTIKQTEHDLNCRVLTAGMQVLTGPFLDKFVNVKYHALLPHSLL